MKLLKRVRDLVSGRKAYVIGVLLVVLGLLQGDNQLVLEGVAVITLRAGIAKVNVKK